MGLFDFFRARPKVQGPPPWEGRPSLYRHIAGYLDGHGMLAKEGDALPDADVFYRGEKIRWVSGGQDGVSSHHSASQTEDKVVKEAADLLFRISKSGSLEAKVRLYDIAVDMGSLHLVDPLLAALEKRGLDLSDHLAAFAQWLAFEGADREPVKLGIALLGAVGNPVHLDAVRTLGKHEEFTLYAAIAMARFLEEPRQEIWNLAKCVSGWGRIHLVERLAEFKDPAIKAWLIRDGYRNQVMNEYLALICATAGDLHLEITAADVDQALFDGTGELLSALIDGGPVPGIEDYPHAAQVVQAYLGHALVHAATVRHFVDVMKVDLHLEELASAPDKLSNGWTAEAVARGRKTARDLLSDRKWPGIILPVLETGSERDYFIAEPAAGALGMDAFPILWKRLEANPSNSHYWASMMKYANLERIASITAFAESALPLDAMATGPADELGMGPAFQVHSCLDFILQDLGTYPGHGLRLITCGLRSPVTRNRNMAAKALGKWGREKWPPEARRALEAALAAEPVEDGRKLFQDILDGKEPAPPF